MKRPPEELVETSRHVLYEVHMLEVTASAIASEVYKGEMLNNALVESFLIHARNLIDFLFSEGRYDTDVLAVHFLDDPDRWESQRGAPSATRCQNRPTRHDGAGDRGPGGVASRSKLTPRDHMYQGGQRWKI